MTTKKTGFPFLNILALIFITLKLTHVIAWSWWWVTAPIWGIPAIYFLIFIVGASAITYRHVAEIRLEKRLMELRNVRA